MVPCAIKASEGMAPAVFKNVLRVESLRIFAFSNASAPSQTRAEQLESCDEFFWIQLVTGTYFFLTLF
jgi:hypothetical protein